MGDTESLSQKKKKCLVSGVRCNVSGVRCHLSRVSNADSNSDSPSANSPTMHNRMVCKDLKNQLFSLGNFRPFLSQHCKVKTNVFFIILP